MAKKDDVIEVEATVLETLPNAVIKVKKLCLTSL